MTGHDPLDHAWWLASRSAGIVAYLLLSASVVLGLTMALRLAPVRMRGDLRVLHERLALLALGSVATHALLLLGDTFLHPGLTGVLIPFATPYRPVWTGFGILAAYSAAGLSLTYYARRRIGARRWRALHQLIPIAWGMAAVHVLGSGTDARSLWLLAPIALTMAAIATLLVFRVLREQDRTTAPAASPPTPPTAPAPMAAPRPARLWSTDRG